VVVTVRAMRGLSGGFVGAAVVIADEISDDDRLPSPSVSRADMMSDVILSAVPAPFAASGALAARAEESSLALILPSPSLSPADITELVRSSTDWVESSDDSVSPLKCPPGPRPPRIGGGPD
jgi:hypothetical protein